MSEVADQPRARRAARAIDALRRGWTFRVTGADGGLLGEMEIWAAVAEDPAITLMPRAHPGDTLSIAARDTNGRAYLAKVTVARQSPLPAATGATGR